MSAPTALVGAAALIGPHLHPTDDAIVVIAGGRIVGAGAAGTTPIPDDATVVDADGLMLIPGYIDAHVHIGFVDPLDVLKGGVTTARDLAWPVDEIMAMVDASASDPSWGPALVAAGPMLTVAGGYPTRAAWAPEGTGLVVDGPADAVTAVDGVAAGGATVIKVALNPSAGPTLDPQTLRTIVEIAHRNNLRVTAHVDGLDQLDVAIAAGIDELAHMLMGEERIPDETLTTMIRRGMVVVPTLAIRTGRELDVAIDNLSRFAAAGGEIAYGTDLGNAGPRPGIDRGEVVAMAEAGMKPEAILRSATIDSARHLGFARKGRLDAGMDADIVALGGDPRAGLEALLDVRRVWRLGREVARGS